MQPITLMLRAATAALFALCLLLAPNAFAQDTGTILGKVTDPSGAVVPNIHVELTNTDTNVTQTTVTNQLGDYVFNLVRIGNYALRVEGQGFRTAARSNLVLNVQQTVRVDFTLQLGTVGEVIEISAESPLLETVNSSSGQVVRNKEIVDLPLNGRDYQQLALLTAGTVPTRGISRGTGDFSAGGARPVSNNFLLDGIDNNSYIVDLQGATSQVAGPSVDAIQEFKVQTNNFSAEFGRNGGAVLNVSIKSGTNAFHGSVFEFLRNSALDANEFFNNRASRELPPFRQNQFGGTLGGPIKPDKLFFFGSYQGTRISQGVTSLSTVPTEAERNGVFSRPIYDPRTTRQNPSGSGSVRVPFANNTIPQERFDPVGKRLMDVYPAPNLQGANNYILNPANAQNVDQFDGRFDWNLTSKDSIFGRYSYTDDEQTNEGSLPPPAVGQVSAYKRPVVGHSAALAQTHIFGPSTINEFRAGYNRQDAKRLPQVGERIIEDFGFRGLPFFPEITGLPAISVTGYRSLGENGTLPNLKLSQVVQFANTLSHNRGSHSIRAGADIRFIVSNAFTPSGTRGSFSFNGAFTQNPQSRGGTGSALADLLLGVPSGASTTTPTDADLRQRYYGFYIQDDWRATRRLTLNLGLRWDFNTPFWENYDRWSNFVTDPASRDFGTFVLAGSRGDSVEDRALVPFYKKDLAPRVGLAYRLTEKIVVRSAYGIFNSGTALIGINGTLAFNPPNTAGYAIDTDQLTPRFFLEEGFAPGLLDPTIDQINRGVISYHPKRNGYLQQWSLGVQNEFLPNMLLDLSYMGTAGHHLVGSRAINQPRPGPGARQPRSPFPQFTGVSRVSDDYNSAYHAFTAKLERRFAAGIGLIAAYTWSHFLDDTQTILDVSGAGAQDSYDRRAEWGNSNYDIRHRFVTSYTYDLPFGRGKRFASEGVLSHIIGGWQLNGIVSAQSGRPFTPLSNVNTCNCGGSSRPDRIGSGVLPSDERSIDRWFDVEAFSIPVGYVFGNSGRNILTGPGLFTWDFSLFKNFQVRENVRVQFRFESFNFTNHPNFGLPADTIGTSAVGTISDTVTSPRQNQFGLKLIF